MSKKSLRDRQKDIEKLTSAIVNNYIEFSSILLYAPRVAVHGDYICKTDGKIIKVGDKFFEADVPKRVYTLIKTAFHCALRHHNRASELQGNRIAHVIWEIATSAIVNEHLKGCFRENKTYSININEIEGIIKYDDLEPLIDKLGGDTSKMSNAETMFTILAKGVDKQEVSLEDMPNLKESDENISSQEFMESSDVLDANGLSEINYKDGSSQIADQLWNQRLEETIKNFGSGSGSSLMGLLEHLSKPKTDWQAILRTFMTVKLSTDREPDYSRPSRRNLAGVTKYFQPNRKKKVGIKTMVVCLDLSGSCWNSQTQSMFISNIDAIHKATNSNLVLITFDDGVQDVFEVPYGKTLSTMVNEQEIELSGGGGTEFIQCIERALEYNPTVIAVMTDCWGPFGEDPGVPTIWASIGDPAPWGRTLLIDESLY